MTVVIHFSNEVHMEEPSAERVLPAPRVIEVQVKPDFLRHLGSTKKPSLAIAELIWNSLDADAANVRVHLKESALEIVEVLSVTDDGLGIPYSEAEAAFSNLGGSWKQQRRVTRNRKRPLHGKAGQGRFSVFSLGTSAKWDSRYKDGNSFFQFDIAGSVKSIGKFHLSQVQPQAKATTGMSVTVHDIAPRVATALRASEIAQELSDTFALYLMSYPDIRIHYGNTRLDPLSAVQSNDEYDLEPVALSDGTLISAKLQIIEWKTDKPRSFHLCDAAGLSLQQANPGIQAPGFSFAAYLKAEYLRQLYDNDLLVLDEVHPDTIKLVTQARDKLRDHFRLKAAKGAAAVVEEWKREKIYPFKGPPRDLVEQAERQVFDVVALNVNDFHPDFQNSDLKSKEFLLRLLKEVLGDSPDAMRRILEEVFDLSKEKLNELAELVEQTSLAAIINASKVVTDRLKFLTGLDALVFDMTISKTVLERRHLQKILEEQTWIFGEEFNLTVPDRSLTEALREHYKLCDQDLEDDCDVLMPDGKKGILDLMLSRKIPQPDVDRLVHLVIELKRPSRKIDSKAVEQIKKYALAVAKDPRFRNLHTQWIFWVLSADMDEIVKEDCRQPNRPEGVLWENTELNIRVWARTWSELVQSCRKRLEFFRKELGGYSPDKEAGIAYLHKLHAKYLPDELDIEPVQND
jgi:hypothetical protein